MAAFAPALPPTATSNNPWFVVSVGLLCFIAGFGASSLGIFSGVSPAAPQVAVNPTVPVPPSPPTVAPEEAVGDVPAVDRNTDHIRGNVNAEISVIEYSDFECPFCIRHHPTMKQVMEKYGDKVNWVYRHFPLAFHPKAEPAALASECIAELGGNDAFWKFTDAVFEQNNYDYPAIARSLGVNEVGFKTCFDSARHKQKIQDQMAGGSAAGVNGTPGTIVLRNASGEAKLVSGAVPLASFEAAIDGFLQ